MGSDEPLSFVEEVKIFRYHFAIAEVHELKVPPVKQWEPDEARDLMECTAEEQYEIMNEKRNRAADLSICQLL